jgi:putative membrane protein
MKAIRTTNHVLRAGRLPMIALLTFGFCASSGTAQSSRGSEMSSSRNTGSSGSESTLNHSEKHFIEKAGKGSKEEVALGELALQKSSNPDVKDFARQLINDHRQANAEFSQLAEKGGVSIDFPEWSRTGTSEQIDTSQFGSDVTSEHRYRELAGKSGSDFDKTFVKLMVDDHKKDIKEFQKEATDAADPAVRSFAANTVPKLQAHLDHAERLSDIVGK